MTVYMFVDLDGDRETAYDTDRDTPADVLNGLGLVEDLIGEVRLITDALDRGESDLVSETIIGLDVEIHDPIHGNCY